MLDLALPYERWFLSAGRVKSALAGAVIGGLFLLPAFFDHGSTGFLLGLLVYLVPQVWLGISLLLVLFSPYERERLLGARYSALAGFSARLFGPFAFFCFGWFYALLGFGLYTGTLH